MKWYNKTLPTIGDILPHIKEVASSLSKITNVKNIYAWGQFAENLKNPKFHIKDAEIVIDSNLHSQDLLAIDQNDSTNPLNMSNENLEDSGFNIQSILFTKSMLKYQSRNIDFWLISKDKKVLHWGPVTETVEEWKELRKQAEENAQQMTKISRKSLKTATTEERKLWYDYYDTVIQNFASGSPMGWYESLIDIDEMIKDCIKI